MGFFDFFRREKRAAEPECDDILLRAIITGEPLSEETAMTIPVFSACVDFIACTIAGLPVKLYRDCAVHQTAEEITQDRRIGLLNDDGGDLLTAYETRRAQITDMLLYGAGYMYIDKYGANIRSLRYVRKQSVSVTVNADPIFKDADLSVNSRHYYPWEFVTITRHTKNGVTGVGLLEQISKLLNTMYNELLYEGSVARTGGNKKGFLQSEKKLSEDAMTRLKAAWRELYANNGDNMMVLNDGVKYQQAASTSVEMQLNEHKLTNAGMIALVFGLSPEVVSGKASADEYMSAVRSSMISVVESYQAALNRSLLTESEKAQGLYFELDTNELLRGDMTSRFSAYATALQNNIMSIDEVRYRENLPPLGFNYMKLGLADVLFDPKTGTLITPNTGITQNTAGKPLTGDMHDGIIEPEIRKKDNWVKGSKGYFAGSISNGSGGQARMTRKEYDRLCSEIVTNHPFYKNGSIRSHRYGDHFYIFSVIEPGTYRFTHKVSLNNKHAISRLERIIDDD